MKLYKVLGEGGKPCNGGKGEWHLPKGSKPGKWMKPIKGEIVPCKNGYHLCREKDLLGWLNATIYEAEHRGELVEHGDKVVVREARLIKKLNWNERTARLFAADCAAAVLPIFEKQHPKDKRPRRAIKAARDFANGKISSEKMAAARDAARAAQTKLLIKYLYKEDK